MAQVDLSRISESDQELLVRLLKRVMGMPDEPKAAVAVIEQPAEEWSNLRKANGHAALHHARDEEPG
jgi:hypothetical protein